MTDGRPQIITSNEMARALADAGVIESLDTCRRIVIDIGGPDGCPVNPVMIYVERFGDDRLLQVAQTLEGVEISGVPAPEGTWE